MQYAYPLGFEEVRRGGSTQVKDVPSKDAPQEQLQSLTVILYGIQLPVKQQALMKPAEKAPSSLEQKAMCFHAMVLHEGTPAAVLYATQPSVQYQVQERTIIGLEAECSHATLRYRRST